LSENTWKVMTARRSKAENDASWRSCTPRQAVDLDAFPAGEEALTVFIERYVPMDSKLAGT
jgi:hypothetical protein